MGTIMKPLVIIGSGGHAGAILSVMDKTSKNEIIGYVDIKPNKNFSKRFSFIGSDQEFTDKYSPDAVELILGISYLEPSVNLTFRKEIIKFYKSKNYSFFTVISEYSYLAKNVTVEEGCFVAPGAKLISNAKISRYCSINTGVIIEHDVVLEQNVQVSPGAIICGGAKVGQNTFIGAGTIIRDDIEIANDTIVGMGSLVLKNLEEPGIYFGNPLKKII
jgi:sugar O-acyltransferase (sialic acid O-acetyltransferase NeuD family)